MAKPVVSEVPADAARENAVADLELSLLLEAIQRSSGYDFGNYAPATLKRRVAERVRVEGVATISGLQDRVLHDPDALARFVLAMSNGHTRLFEDPEFFRTFRARVVPLLRTYSFTRIWIPNCASGEEAYSIAVLLHESGLLERSMIYATDVSELAITAARAGEFEIDSPQAAIAAHRATGAELALTDVCEFGDRSARFGDALRPHMIFAQHSLVTDGSINEFHVIVARGILPQFNRTLQFRVHNLFLSSLVRLGFLCLASNETLRQTPHESVFRRFGDDAPIYRRMR